LDFSLTATSLEVSSGTSSPPFTTLTVTSPCGSDAFTAARSTFAGCCTPMVTSTCMRRESRPKLRMKLSEL
jgi:hypothetical protein